MALLEIAGVGFTVDGRRVLDTVDLTVGEGEIHALLGANATGKSTLAFLVMGCDGYAPTSGEIRFDGRRIDGLALHERAHLGITLAWQEPARFEGITAARYLTLGRPDADPGHYLRLVGLGPETYLDRMVDRTLSGGQRKRLELASVLALEPRLAILDEPTAGIDLLSLDEIVGVIRAFGEHGGAVLLITHQEEVARIAHRASQLCGGRVVASGDPGAVIARYKARRCAPCDGKECERGGAG